MGGKKENNGITYVDYEVITRITKILIPQVEMYKNNKVCLRNLLLCFPGCKQSNI